MSPTVEKLLSQARYLALFLALLTCWMASDAARAGQTIPRPEGIQSDVNFWIRVYTEVTTNEGFLHD
jgi:membrane-bound lytic murein transglycosylase D